MDFLKHLGKDLSHEDIQNASQSLFEALLGCTSVDLNRYLDYLGQSAPATIQRKLISLKKFFAWAYKHQHRKKEPPEFPTRLPKQQPLAPRWLSKNQVDALIRKAEQDHHSLSSRNVVIIKLMLHTGLRVSEVVDLKWEDIVIRRYEGHLTVHCGKGSKKRIVPLNSTIRGELEKYKEHVKESQKDKPYVFYGTRGKLTTDGVLRMFYKFEKLLPFDVTPHCLRHTFCKSLLDKGVLMSEIAAMAGHSSLNTTNKYVTPSMENLGNSVEKIT